MARDAEESLGDIRNALLVIAALIASATYQAVLQPPSFKIKYQSTYNKYLNSWLTDPGVSYVFFISGNTFGFMVSVQMIICLTKDLPFRLPLLLSVAAMFLTYFTYVIFLPFTLLDKEYGLKTMGTLSILPLVISGILLVVQWWLARGFAYWFRWLSRFNITGDMYNLRPQSTIVNDGISLS